MLARAHVFAPFALSLVNPAKRRLITNRLALPYYLSFCFFACVYRSAPKNSATRGRLSLSLGFNSHVDIQKARVPHLVQ